MCVDELLTTSHTVTGNLDTQIHHLTAEVATRLASVAGVVTHVGSGFDPSWAGDAARIKKQHDAKVVGLAASHTLSYLTYTNGRSIG